MGTIDAVARGARDDKAIAAAIGGLDARQRRYYRRAAEVLGFTARDANHHSIVTPAGKEFASADSAVKQGLFVRAVLSNPLFQRLLPFLEAKGATGATRDELELFLNAVAELGAASMVERRVSSYQGWLVKLGLAKMAGRRCVLDHLPAAVPLVRYESDEEPIFPNRYDLKEYQEQAQRVASKQEAIEYYVEPWKVAGLPSNSRIVFVDDLIGTGSQSVDYINRKLSSLFASSHRPCLFSVCATPTGIEAVKQYSTFEVICAMELEELVFNHYDERNATFTSTERKNLHDLNERLGQNFFVMGLLVAFYYSSPDNTMPLIWRDGIQYTDADGRENSWFALLPRKS